MPTPGLQTRTPYCERSHFCCLKPLGYGGPRTQIQPPRPGWGRPLGECAVLHMKYLFRVVHKPPPCPDLFSLIISGYGGRKTHFMYLSSLTSRSHCVVLFWPVRPK